MTNAKCPCCGGKVTASKLIVDLDANVALFSKKIERLRPQTAEFLYILNKKYPSAVRHDELLGAIYGQGDWPIKPRKNLYVLVYQMRAIGKRLGFEVEGTYKRGFRLRFSPP